MDWKHFRLVRIPVFQEELTAPDNTFIRPDTEFVTLEQSLDARIGSLEVWTGCLVHSTPNQLTARQSEYIADPPRILWLQLNRMSNKMIKRDHQVR